MGQKRKSSLNRTGHIIAALLIAFAAVVFAVIRIGSSGGTTDGTAAIRDALRSSAMQCYVIEGAYPESLDYLTENYGLSVNTEDYDIIYIVYAENLPPEIKVVRKE